MRRDEPTYDETLEEALAAVIGDPQGTVAEARILIKAGADINHIVPRVDGNAHMPLISLAVINKRLDMAELLMAHGVNLEEPNANGATALLLAARYAPSHLIAALLDGGARMDAVNKSDEDVLHYAAQNRDLGGLALFVSLGARMQHNNDFGESPLDYARSTGMLYDVEAIFRNARPLPRLATDGVEPHGLSLFAKNSDGYCVLDRAETWHAMSDVMWADLSKKDLLERCDQKGRPWLVRAIECRQLLRVQEALDAQGEDLFDSTIWVDAKGSATPMLATLVDKQSAATLFKGDFFNAFSERNLRRIYLAIPESERGQVPNLQQLIVSKSRSENQEKAVG